MPAGSFIGLTSAPALNVSANSHSISADNLTGRLQGLIAAMERDVEAQQGNALGQFQIAKQRFFTAYGTMAQNYHMSAMAQDQTGREVHTADALNEEEYASNSVTAPDVKPIKLV